MKLVLFLFLSLTLFGQTPPQKIKRESHSMQAGPNVKTLWYSIDYDQQGRQTRWTTYRAGVLQDYRVYTYNPDGTVLADTLYDPKGKVVDHWHYQYNARRELVRQDRYYTDGNRYYAEIYKHEYDSLGNMVKETQLDKDSILDWERFHEYKGKKYVHYLSKFQGKSREEYQYEYKDTLRTKEILYSYDTESGEPELFCIWNYTYDAKGLKIKSDALTVAAYLKGKRQLDTSKYFYDANNRLIREERYKNKELTAVELIEYEVY